MKHREVFEFIDSIAPFSTQYDFDNAGFLVGDPDGESEKAVVTLDATLDAINFAKEKNATLIITHHPIIFDPVKSVIKGTALYEAVSSGISVISAHTNFDKAAGGVTDCLCDKIGLINLRGIIPESDGTYGARMGELQNPVNAEDFSKILAEKLGGGVRYSAFGELKTVAVVSGAGGSMLEDISKYNPDAFVTADVKHSVFLRSRELGISIYDCGHFETEDVAISPLTEKLRQKFGDNFYEYHESNIKTVR